MIAKLARSIIGKVQSKRKLKYYSMDSICYFIYIVLSILHARANRFEIHIISGFKVTGRQETHVKQKYEEWFDAVWKRFSPNSFDNSMFQQQIETKQFNKFLFLSRGIISIIVYTMHQMLFFNICHSWQDISMANMFENSILSTLSKIKFQITAIIFLITSPC